MLSKKKINTVKTKEQIANAWIQSLQQKQPSTQISLLTGYLCFRINMTPSKQSIQRLQKILMTVYQYQYMEQDLISFANFVEIVVEASSVEMSKDGKDYDHCAQFSYLTREITKQVCKNNKYLRKKWQEQDKVELQKTSLIKKQKSSSQIIQKISKQRERLQERQIQVMRSSPIKQQRKSQLIKSSLMKQQKKQQMKKISSMQESKIKYSPIKQNKKQQMKISSSIKENKKQVMKSQQINQDEERTRKYIEQLMKKEEQLFEKHKQDMTCSICLQYIEPQQIGTMSCQHIFHIKCIRNHIENLVDQKKLQILCPAGCGTEITIQDIQDYIDGDLKRKFDQHGLDLYAKKNQNEVSWCPTADCTAVFTAEGGLTNYNCPICKKKYCLQCRCEYHKGMTCKEYKINNKKDINDDKFEQFAKGAKLKQCPKCKLWVQKSAGCVSINCRCGQQFCYNCGGIDCPHGNCKQNLTFVSRLPRRGEQALVMYRRNHQSQEQEEQEEQREQREQEIQRYAPLWRQQPRRQQKKKVDNSQYAKLLLLSLLLERK